jgi:hypothetical protein
VVARATKSAVGHKPGAANTGGGGIHGFKGDGDLKAAGSMVFSGVSGTFEFAQHTKMANGFQFPDTPETDENKATLQRLYARFLVEDNMLRYPQTPAIVWADMLGVSERQAELIKAEITDSDARDIRPFDRFAWNVLVAMCNRHVACVRRTRRTPFTKQLFYEIDNHVFTYKFKCNMINMELYNYFLTLVGMFKADYLLWRNKP